MVGVVILLGISVVLSLVAIRMTISEQKDRGEILGLQRRTLKALEWHIRKCHGHAPSFRPVASLQINVGPAEPLI